MDKTIYSPKKFGIGLASITIALTNRILDTTHNIITNFPSLQYLMPPAYLANYFRPATEFLGANTYPMPHIEPPTPSAKDGWEYHEGVGDFHIFKTTHQTQIQAGHAYTDGSFQIDMGCSGVVVLPGGMVYGCKLVGHQLAYKGEMAALFLVAHYSEAGTTIHVDCKGVISSVMKGGKRVVMGELVKQIRALIYCAVNFWNKIFQQRLNTIGLRARCPQCVECLLHALSLPSGVPMNTASCPGPLCTGGHQGAIFWDC